MKLSSPSGTFCPHIGSIQLEVVYVEKDKNDEVFLQRYDE